MPTDWGKAVEEEFGGASQRATTSAIVGMQEDHDPDSAAQALDIAEQTGQNPALVYGNLADIQERRRQEANTALINNNEHLQRYINENPLANVVSSNDWGNLDEVSMKATQLHPEPEDMATANQAETILHAPGSTVEGLMHGFREGFEAGPAAWDYAESVSPELKNANSFTQWQYKALGYPIGLMNNVLAGALEGVHQAALAAAKPFMSGEMDPYGDTSAESFAKDITGMFEAEIQRSSGRLGATEEAKALIENLQSAKPFAEAHKQSLFRAYPGLARFVAQEAKGDAKQLDDIIASAQNSSTKEQAPKLFEKFYGQHTNAKIGIDPDGIKLLYGDERIPEANDSKLGFIKDLQDQVAAARDSGSDVQVPIKSYVTNIDPAVHKELSDFIRVRRGGMTRAEAREHAPVFEEFEPEEGFTGLHTSPHSFDVFAPYEEVAHTGATAASFGGGHYIAQEEGVIEDYFHGFKSQPRYLMVGDREIPLDTRRTARTISPTSEQIATRYLHGAGGDIDTAIRRALDEAPESGASDILKDWKKQGIRAGTPYIYKLHIRRPEEHFLDWDKPFDQQSPYVQEALKKIPGLEDRFKENPTGQKIYEDVIGRDLLLDRRLSKLETSNLLHSVGIAGNRYLDQGSRNLVFSQDKLDGARATLETTKESLKDLEKSYEKLKQQIAATPEESGENAFNRRQLESLKDRISKADAQVDGWEQEIKDLEDLRDGKKLLTSNHVVFDHNDIRIIKKVSGDSFQQALDRLREIAGLNHAAERRLDWNRVEPAKQSTNLMEKLKPERVDTQITDSEVPRVKPFSATHKLQLSDVLKNLDFSYLENDDEQLLGFITDRLFEQAGSVPVYIASQSELNRGTLAIDSPGFHQRGFGVVLSKELMQGNFPQWYQNSVVLEEALHSISSEAIDQFEGIQEVLDHMMDRVRQSIPKEYLERHDWAYALTNRYEFYSNILSRRNMMATMKQITLEANDPIRKILGMDNKSASLWEAFRQMLKRVLARVTGRTNIPDTMLDAFFRLSEGLEEANKVLRKEGNKFVPEPSFAEAPKEPVEPTEPGEVTPKVTDKVLFEKGALRYLTRKQFLTWRQQIRDRAESDLEQQRKLIQAQELRHQQKAWKEALPRVQSMARQDVLSRPDIAADQLLGEGRYNDAKLKNAPKIRRYSIPEELRGKIPAEFIADNGFDLDDMANFVGYPTGYGLAEGLIGLAEQRELEGITRAMQVDQLTKAYTERYMLREFGKPEDNAVDAAMEHMLDDSQFEMLHQDMLALVDAGGQTEMPISKEMVAKRAAQQFNGIAVGHHDSGEYLRAAGVAGRRGQAAWIDQNPTEALKQLQVQTIALHKAKLAQRLEKEHARLDRLAKRFKQRDFDSIDQQYTNWVHSILNQVGYDVRSKLDLDREISHEPQTTLRDFVNHVNNPEWLVKNPDLLEDFEQLRVAPFLFDPAFKTTVDELLPDALVEVHDSLKALVKAGRDQKSWDIGNQRTAIGNAVSTMEDQLESIFHGLEKLTIGMGAEKGRRYVFDTALAALLPIEDIFRRIDRGDPDGLFTQITRQIFEAVNDRDAKIGQYADKYRSIIKFPTPAEMQRLTKMQLFDPLNKRMVHLTKENVLAIVQNWGNASNRDKLIRGYQIEDPEAFEQELMENTTDEDWNRAQQIGDIFGELFEELADMYRELTGVAPKRIELEPFIARGVKYKGWYHKVVYDPDRPGESLKGMGPQPMEDGSFFTRAAPSQSHVKERTGYAAPLLLNMRSIPQALEQMINNVTMRPAITQTAKVFYNPQFRMAFKRNAGVAMEGLLIPWLKDVANMHTPNDQVATLTEKLINKYRRNLISSLIGYNPVTVFKHAPTAAVLSMKEVGIKDFMRELGTVIRQLPAGNEEAHFALGKSEELQRRVRHWDGNLSGAERDVFQNPSFKDKLISYYAMPIAGSDLLSAIPTWLAIYKRSIRQGLSEGDAIYRADFAVRRAHGTTSVAGRARILRSNGLAALAVPFYTFFNRMFSGVYEMGWRANDALGYFNEGQKAAGAEQLKKLMPMFFAYVAFPALVEQLLDPVGSKNDSEGKRIFKIGLRSALMPVPIIRDMAEAYAGGHDPSIGLYATGAQEFSSLVSDLGKGTQIMSRQNGGKTIKDVSAIMGTLTGFTNAQEGRWGEYAWNFANNQDRAPKNAGELWSAFAHGYVEQPRRHR